MKKLGLCGILGILAILSILLLVLTLQLNQEIDDLKTKNQKLNARLVKLKKEIQNLASLEKRFLQKEKILTENDLSFLSEIDHSFYVLYGYKYFFLYLPEKLKDFYPLKAQVFPFKALKIEFITEHKTFGKLEKELKNNQMFKRVFCKKIVKEKEARGDCEVFF